MRPVSVSLVAILFLSVTVTDALNTTNSLNSRILEILKGPPQKVPLPPVKAAFLLCQRPRPGSENGVRALPVLRAAGVPSILLTSVNPNPNTWSALLNNMLISYQDHLLSFVLDMGCPGAMNLLQKANDTNMFRSPYRWLLIFSSSNATAISLETCGVQAEAVLGNLAIFLDSEVLSLCRYGENGQSGLIIEWYRHHFHEHPFMGELGSWQGGPQYSRIKWTQRSFKPLAVRRFNLMGLPVTCGFVLRHNETFSHLMDGVDKRTDTAAKFFYPLLTNTVEMMNGTLFARWTDNWGYPVNGTWTGMVGLQLSGEVDISGIPALMEHVRNTVLSFVAFKMPIAGTILFRAAPLSYEENLYTLPFPKSLWAAAGGLTCLCVLLLYLVLTAEDIMEKNRPCTAPATIAAVPTQSKQREKVPNPFLAPEPNEEATKDNTFSSPNEAAIGEDGIQAKARLHGSWSDVIFLVFGAICQQGSPVEARSIPSRIVSISLLVAIIFLFTSYSASIVVLLQSTSNSIQTLEDLWKSKMACGAEDLSYNRYLFTQVKGEDRLGIRKKFERKNKNTPSGDNYMPLDLGMHKLRTEYFAFHTVTTSAFSVISDTWFEHEKCSLREIPHFYYPQHPYVSTSKFHPIVEMFRITLRKMQERGIRDRETGRIIPAKPKCIDQGYNFSSVSLTDCYFAMVCLLVGILASLVVFGLEHFAAYRRQKGNYFEITRNCDNFKKAKNAMNIEKTATE